MSRTFLRQDTQIYPSLSYTDNTAAGKTTLQDNSTDIEYDLNSVRAQLKRILDHSAGQWYDDVSTVDGKKRSLKSLNVDLDDMEEKRLLFRAQVLTDVTVAAAVAADGSLTARVKTDFTDADNFTLNDGVHTATVFYFDVSGSYTPPGGVEIDISGAADANAVATLMRSAINGAPTLDITATGTNTAVLLANDTKGTIGNIDILQTVTNTLTPVGMHNGTGDQHTLSVSGLEAPTEVAAVGTSSVPGSAIGAVVVALPTGVIGRWSSAYVIGQNDINPKNLVVIRDAVTDDMILSAGMEVFGLIQAQFGTVDADPFDDSTKKVQISFVRENTTTHTLEHVPATDIAGKVINYMYVRRINLDAVPEQIFLTGTFVDQSASVDVTLTNAIANQSGPAPQTQNIEWRITDTKTLQFEDSTGSRNLFAILPTATGDTVQFDIDTFDVNNVNTADFLNGIAVDTSGTTINIGVTAGQIDAAATLTIASTGNNHDLRLHSAEEMQFEDGYYAASTYDTPLVLSDSAAEWSAFEAAFGGEVSLLNAIVQASNKDTHQKLTGVVTTIANAGDNVSGFTAPTKLDAVLIDYSGITDFTSDVNVFVNGQLMRGAAGATHDVYPGTAQAKGDLKFTFKLHVGDVVTMETFGAVA